jgi:hypothetical protein
MPIAEVILSEARLRAKSKDLARSPARFAATFQHINAGGPRCGREVLRHGSHCSPAQDD